MSDSSPKRLLPAPSQTADAGFHWPPTDEELADCFYSGPPDERSAQRGVEVLQKTTSDGTDAKAEPTTPAADCHAADSGKSDVQEPQHRGSDDSTTSAIAVLTLESELDRARENEWAAKIAHLQALIEALTEKVEVPTAR